MSINEKKDYLLTWLQTTQRWWWFGGRYTLKLCIREAVKCFKVELVGHLIRNLEDGGTKGNFNCWGLTQEVSEEKNASM